MIIFQILRSNNAQAYQKLKLSPTKSSYDWLKIWNEAAIDNFYIKRSVILYEKSLMFNV